MRRRASFLAVTAIVALSCKEREAVERRVHDENTSLGGEVAARVGSSGAAESIPLSVVASVAAAQQVTAQDAVKRVIDDEIAASAARRKGLATRPPATWRLTSARANLTIGRFAEEAKRRGPPTDEEVNVLSQRHWLEFARPPAVRVVHAIVMRPKDPANLERARAFAADLRKAVLTAQDAAAFEKSAKSLSTDLDVRVQSLPPFTEEGWPLEGGGRMDFAFTKGAFAIPAVGGTSPVVESSFGWHVIRLKERIPEKMAPLDVRRAAFASETETMRARELMESRLKVLRTEHPVEISPAAEQLMRSVTVVTAGGDSQAKSEGPQP